MKEHTVAQADTKWRRFETGSGPENRQKIIVISPSTGEEVPYVYQDGLLFVPDMSMYVFTDAEYWRPWTEADGD